VSGADDLFRQSFNRAESNYSSQSRRYEEQMMSVEQHNNITLQALYSGLSPDAPSFRPSAYSQASQHQFAQPQFNNMFSYPEDDDAYSGSGSGSSGSGLYYAASHHHQSHMPRQQQNLFMQSNQSHHNQMQQPHQMMAPNQLHHQQQQHLQQQQQQRSSVMLQEEEDELYSRMLSDLDHVADLISDDEDEE
jgi:hypothetical protein